MKLGERAWLEPYRFKKGEPSGNPNGRPTGSFKKASPEALARIVDAYLYGGPTALEDLFNAPDVSPNELFIISVIQRAAHKGDAAALSAILDRFIGKVRDRVEVKAKVQNEALTVDEMTDEELEQRRALLNSAD